MEAHADFSHIHDRMPAVLDGEEAIRTWLDPSLSTQESIKILHPSPSLTWYPVSDVVNNAKNKTPECIMKIDPRYWALSLSTLTWPSLQLPCEINTIDVIEKYKTWAEQNLLF